MPYYNQSTKDVSSEFHVDPSVGLSSAEVARRRAQYGSNSLEVVRASLLRRILEPFLDIFMLILVAALVLSIVQGNTIESITIGVIIAINAIIYYVQSFSTERILRSLRESMVQGVVARRDGEEVSLDASELVPGDIVILREGDRIPADGRIVMESGLLTNESMLTGESEAIAKDAKAIAGAKKVYEQRNMVFSGSFVITGTAEFLVTATGNSTEYGRIASLASSLSEDSPIQQKMNKLVAQIAVVVVILAAIVLVIQLIDQIPLLEALEFTLAMIVSAVPEGLPIAISIILALCAKRMAAKKALVRELQAIESIGIVTTIASDKTGTLTENRLELRELWSPSLGDKELHHILSAAALPEATLIEHRTGVAIDPLDTAIARYLESGHHVSHIEPLQSYAFDQSLKLSGNLVCVDNTLTLYLKGAPETILSRSHLSEATRRAAESKLSDFASHGYKVIALATATIPREIHELEQLDKKLPFTFAGFLAVSDAIRREAPAAIKQAARMGVTTKMITGDHAGTAYAIGRELGLVSDFSEVFDCSRLGSISDIDLAELAGKVTVFARVTPEDKYRILSAIKQREITAMTGDGVNDVPALVGAHVGIAMGDSPSIVQDAGDIVLLDNNFRNITEAIKESRTVLTNIRRMLSYLLSTNAGEVFTMIGSLTLFGSQLLTPIQILWINLVTDSLMVIPIGLEPPEREIFERRPEGKDAPILPFALVVRMIVTAVTMAVGTLVTFFVAEQIFDDRGVASTLAFVTLTTMQWGSAFSARGIYESALSRLKVHHRSFHLALIGAVVLQILAIFGPLATLVGTVPVPPLAALVTALLAFIIPLGIFELTKKLVKG